MKRTFPQLLTPGETAAAFGVDPKTLTHWADAGKLRVTRTLAIDPRHPGHRRFYAAQVEAMLAGTPLTDEELDQLIRGESA